MNSCPTRCCGVSFATRASTQELLGRLVAALEVVALLVVPSDVTGAEDVDGVVDGAGDEAACDVEAPAVRAAVEQAPRPSATTAVATRARANRLVMLAAMLFIGIILFGMLIGAGAQLILGRQSGQINWPMAFASGIGGSFVGGLLSSLIAGDGIELRPSGVFGSLFGAIIVTAVWRWYDSRKGAATSR